MTRLHAVALLAIALTAAPLDGGSSAAEPVKIRVAALTLPVFNPIIVTLMKERGLDRRHPQSDLVIVTADPAIRTFADLKGKTLAADMGSQQYQVVAIYGRARGLTLGSDITVVQASFALARTQLAAGRVDAAMVIEPIVTMMLKDNPRYRMIFNGGTAWREVTGEEGWELVVPLREEFIARAPAAGGRWIAALQEVQAYIKQNVDEADATVARTVKLPPGVFKEAIASGRWVIDVRPAWGAKERKSLWDMFERAVAAKYLDKLPDEAIIYTP